MLKVKNIIGRNEDIVSVQNLNNLYPYGVEIEEENNFLASLSEEENLYDCFLVLLDENGYIETVFDTKKEAISSWLGGFHHELITDLN